MSNNLSCPVCGLPLNEEDKNYICLSCKFRIWKVMSGRAITSKELDQLREKGETDDLEFTSSAGKPYMTTLVLDNKKVVYGFNVKKKKENPTPKKQTSYYNMEIPQNTVNIRLESDAPGRVNITMLGLPKEVAMEINYGIESSRKSECLGCITAAYYVKWILKDTSKTTLHFSVNNLEFANYLLNEMTPRDKAMQYVVGYAWTYLKNFRSWKAVYHHKKKQHLEGSNTSDTFPQGVFPWLNTDIIEGEDYIAIVLPDNPAVTTQFKASFANAVYQESGKDENGKAVYMLPKGAINAAKTWISIVKTIK